MGSGLLWGRWVSCTSGGDRTAEGAGRWKGLRMDEDIAGLAGTGTRAASAGTT